ncbi:hypothetical protein PInf_025789 [Phytophthora infestans]|nr:hypothetical protein PInf_025789 [Phytophthora infestans]
MDQATVSGTMRSIEKPFKGVEAVTKLQALLKITLVPATDDVIPATDYVLAVLCCDSYTFYQCRPKPRTVIFPSAIQSVRKHNRSSWLLIGGQQILVTGDFVPADIRLFTSVDLKCNEMLLTGKSEDVPKKYNAPIHPAGAGKPAKLTASNMVFSSTTITAGNARGIVVETGMNTRVGSIAALLQAKSGTDASAENKWTRNPLGGCIAKHRPKLTPLQRALHSIEYVMGLIAVGVAILVFIVGMIRGNEDPRHPDRPTCLNMIMAAVSVAVSAVPEGLPMVVTICLSSGTSEMVKKNMLVRKLASVETLGAASVFV